MLTLNNITYRIAGRTLLEQASIFIPKGYRVGLVGPNGTGKTTLFKLIAQELELDNGEISIISDARIGMVRQDLPDDDTPLIDVVLSADTERAELFAELETTDDVERMSDIYIRLADIDAYEAPTRASIILSGLGFDVDEQSKPICDFSGGWRMRVALAAALFRRPELLLLDEPTNHLDFEAIIWLENYLIKYPNNFIIISHDREILNKTVTHIVHLDQLKLTMYTGNYDQFETMRAQAQMNQQALFEKQQAHKDKMLAFVKRFGAKASKAKQAQSRLKAVEKMDLVDAIIAERSTRFRFPQPEELGSPIITIDHVDVGYTPGKPVLKDINLSIGMDDRIALLGANGNGKSTLVKLISNRLEKLSGDLLRQEKLRIGYFAQHQSDEMDLTKNPYEILREAIRGVPEHNLRAMLGKFGFDKAKADTKVGELSGGEKARLLFCLMSYNAPHIMLLDEPTNHLDIDARAALIQALNDYEGCVILVSHDPHLVEAVADQLLLIKDQHVTSYTGDLEAYRQLVIDQRRKERSDSKKEKKEKKKEKKQQQNHSTNNKDTRLKEAEALLNRWSTEKTDIEVQMSSDKALNSPDYMAQLVNEYEQMKLKVTEAEEAWLKIEQAD